MHTIKTEPDEVETTSLSSIRSKDDLFHSEIFGSITRILLVDDEHHMAEEISELLTFDNFMQCDIAGDAIQTMDMIEADEDILIIVTDLKMPSQNGLTKVQELRDRYVNTTDFAVIVITGNAESEEAIEAIRFEAMDFFTKPISSDHLSAAIVKSPIPNDSGG
ncbi:MAG: DNA-binding NtrC family response regulator [Candidatus Azotimanducaceae bacterium]